MEIKLSARRIGDKTQILVSSSSGEEGEQERRSTESSTAVGTSGGGAGTSSTTSSSTTANSSSAASSSSSSSSSSEKDVESCNYIGKKMTLDTTTGTARSTSGMSRPPQAEGEQQPHNGFSSTAFSSTVDAASTSEPSSLHESWQVEVDDAKSFQPNYGGTASTNRWTSPTSAQKFAGAGTVDYNENQNANQMITSYTGHFQSYSMDPDLILEEQLARQLLCSSICCFPLFYFLPANWNPAHLVMMGNASATSSSTTAVASSGASKAGTTTMMFFAKPPPPIVPGHQTPRSGLVSIFTILSFHFHTITRAFYDVLKHNYCNGCRTLCLNAIGAGCQAPFLNNHDNGRFNTNAMSSLNQDPTALIYANAFAFGFCGFVHILFLTVALQIGPLVYGPSQSILPSYYIVFAIFSWVFWTKAMLDVYFVDFDLYAFAFRTSKKAANSICCRKCAGEMRRKNLFTTSGAYFGGKEIAEDEQDVDPIADLYDDGETDNTVKMDQHVPILVRENKRVEYYGNPSSDEATTSVGTTSNAASSGHNYYGGPSTMGSRSASRYRYVIGEPVQASSQQNKTYNNFYAGAAAGDFSNGTGVDGSELTEEQLRSIGLVRFQHHNRNSQNGTAGATSKSQKQYLLHNCLHLHGAARICFGFVLFWPLLFASIFSASFGNPGYEPEHSYPWNIDPFQKESFRYKGNFAVDKTNGDSVIGQYGLYFSDPKKYRSILNEFWRHELTNYEKEYMTGIPLVLADKNSGATTSSGNKISPAALAENTKKVDHMVAFDFEFCPSSHIWKPYFHSQKVHHCRICQHCTFHFDHHCPFIGNCVGGMNFKAFSLFIFFAFVWGLYAIWTLACETMVFTLGMNPLSDLEYELHLSYSDTRNSRSSSARAGGRITGVMSSITGGADDNHDSTALNYYPTSDRLETLHEFHQQVLHAEAEKEKHQLQAGHWSGAAASTATSERRAPADHVQLCGLPKPVPRYVFPKKFRWFFDVFLQSPYQPHRRREYTARVVEVNKNASRTSSSSHHQEAERIETDYNPPKSVLSASFSFNSVFKIRTGFHLFASIMFILWWGLMVLFPGMMIFAQAPKFGINWPLALAGLAEPSEELLNAFGVKNNLSGNKNQSKFCLYFATSDCMAYGTRSVQEYAWLKAGRTEEELMRFNEQHGGLRHDDQNAEQVESSKQDDSGTTTPVEDDLSLSGPVPNKPVVKDYSKLQNKLQLPVEGLTDGNKNKFAESAQTELVRNANSNGMRIGGGAGTGVDTDCFR
ncbi:unnamed protein product [Amoebophrya sp. A120]|nr:unnamed protein product [Amoebophrya sp. A120]|eukprot:GSA120T00009887001.1